MRSLVNHIDELRVLLATSPIDVLTINETWLNSTISDNDVYIPGYETIRRDRAFRSADGKTYGGVCFYVRSSVNFVQRKDMFINDLENLCIQIQKPNAAENVEHYLLGDLNCDLGSPDLESNSRSLIGITELYGLYQLIGEPTRITETSSTMIDHIFTNTPDKNVCSGVSHVGISDHSLIYAFRKLSTGMVCSLLDKLCKSKATGLDKISAKLLRYCPDLLSESLTVIFNCSINTGIFPDEWKCSKVIHYLNTLSVGT